jgi:hypothetical protein
MAERYEHHEWQWQLIRTKENHGTTLSGPAYPRTQ